MKKNLWDDSFLGHFLKRYLFLAVLFLTIGVWGQTTIASEGFNNTSSLFAVSGGAYYTGNSGNLSTDAPANSPFAVEGTHSYGISNGTAILTSSNINTSAYSGISMTLRLASFSIGSTGNGADATDIVTVEVSPDGGATYYSTARVLGNNNATWSYSAGTGNANTPYDGNVTPVDFAPAGGGARTTDGYSTITVTNIPAVSTLRFRITLLNNAAVERWVVDDFKLTGTAGIISTKTGDWSDGNTWVGGNVPTSAQNVVIAAGHTVTITSASGTTLTRNSGTTTTVSSTATLATNIGYVNTGANTTINGSFQLNSGGYVTGNNFVYDSSAGTLVFNTNSTYGVNNTDPYWPTTNGPVNVSLIRTDTSGGTAGLQLNSANRTIPANGTISVSGNNFSNTAGVFLNNSTLTINGKAQIKPFGFFGNTPVYGSSSTLEYNGVGSYNVGNEWTGNSTTAGSGVPQNVSLVSSSINTPNTERGLAGNLIIDASSTFNTYADIYLGGNWANSGTYNTNNKAAFFNGSGAQSVSRTGGETFAYLINNKTAGTLTFASNVTLSGTGGDVLQLIGAGTTDINGKILTFTGANSNIKVANASKTITSSATGAIINFNANTNVITDSASNTLTIGNSTNTAYVTTNINNATVNFGAGGLTTILGNLYMANAGSNVTNGPKYGTSSKLIYSSGSNPFGRTAEWSSNTVGQAGYPQEVQVTSSTTLNYPNTGGSAFSTNLGVAGNLTIDAGSSLYMDYGGANNKSGSLTVGKNITINGNLSLGNYVGGDLFVAGAWSKGAGIFTPNGRQVTFNGASDQSLTGATNFDYLKVDKSGGSVVLGTSSGITVSTNLDFTNRTITLGANNITLSNIATVSNYGSNGYAYVGSSGGKLIRAGLANGQTFVFPIGFSSGLSAYAPIAITNSGSSTSDIGVGGVVQSSDSSVADFTSTVRSQWNVTSSAATTATLAPSWYSAVDNGVSSATSGQLGNYVSSYTVYPATISSYSASASNIALSTSGNKIVVGKTEAIVLGNNTCSNAYSVTVDAAAISGTTVGASSEGTGVPSCSSSNTGVQRDVWYKFTVPAGSEGNYKIDVTNSLNDVVELRSGACTGTVVKCSATSGGVASVTAYLTAGTYYYRVLNDGSSDGTFTTSVSTSPTIVVSPSSLAFGAVPASSTQIKTFTLSGSFLKNANNNITVTAPNSGNEYQLSLDNSTWTTSVNVPYTSATLAATTVYVKFRTENICGTSSGGNITFSAPLATSTPTILLTGSTAVNAPTANAATDNTATTFTAHWNAVAGATGYELDVSTSPTFGIDTATSKTEDFESGLPASGYITNSSNTLTSGEWNFTDVARNTTTSYNYNSSTYGAQLKPNTGIMISPSFNKVTSVTFYATRGTSAASISVYKIVNGVESQLGTAIALSMTPTLYSYTLNETSSDVKIKIVGGASFTVIDHFVVNYFNTVPSFVSGYTALPVSGTSRVVSGLTPNTTYYYRVRAVINACKSSNSNVITAVTNNTVVWNGAAWSNTDGPTAMLDSKVIGNYNLAKSFETKDLEVISTGAINLASGHDVTVHGVVSNSGTITVNNDANFVQKTGSTYSGAGTFTVLKEAKVPSTQFNYWSSPIFGNTSSGQNMYSIYPNIPANRVQIYNTANDRFVTVPNPTYGAPGVGYSVKGPSTNTSTSGVTATFTGTTPNNGDVSVALNRVGYNYNLVGNPYPSNIDLNTFYSDNTEVLANGTFWLWDNTNNTELTQLGTTYTGNSYATWNASSNVGVSGTSTVNSPAKTPTRYVSVAQGFIVEANPSATGSLVFKNSERVSNAGVFFASKNTAENDAYWLELLTPAGVINTQAIVYSADAVNTLDKFDSGLGILGSDSFYSFADADTSELIIQGRKGDLNLTDVVPLGATSFSSGNHSIRLSDKKGIFESGQKIYLHDKLLNQYQDLTAGDYSFIMNKGTINSRFEIVYKDAAVLGNNDFTKSDFRVYRHQDKYIIESSKKLGQVELYDAGGRMIRTYKTDSKLLELDVTTIPSGVYVIKAENSGAVKTKKIRR